MTLSRHKARSAGFTLVELLIVVIILGVLAAVVIPQFQNTTAQAKESSLAASLSTIRQAISLYRVQHDEVYPGQAGWTEFVTQLTTGTEADGTAGSDYGPYIRTSFPNNPVTGTNDGKTAATMPGGPSGPEAYVYSTDTGELRANSPGTAPSGELYWDL